MRGLFHAVILGLLSIAFGDVHLAQAQEDFISDDGFCTLQQVEELKTQSNNFGRSYTLAPTELLSNRGATARKTTAIIPPLTSVQCHAQAGDRVLITTDGKSSSSRFCGWAPATSLLRTVPLGSQILPDKACGKVAALTIKEFCEKMVGFEQKPSECDDPRVRISKIETKFIVDNTSGGQTKDEKGRVIDGIPAYNMPDGTQFNLPGEQDTNKTIKVFNVLRVYDIRRDPSDGSLRYLLGTGNSNDPPVGWVMSGAGRIWYSKLAMFFSKDSSAVVYSDSPTVRTAEVWSGAPSDLAEMLEANLEFQRYPVLLDKRREPNAEDRPRGWKPYLEMAFIGTYCGEAGKLCSTIQENVVDIPYELLNSGDILFLIDGTKSMRDYFGLVARAVSSLAEQYVGNLSYQLGVAMYGDFLSPGATNYGNPLQYKQEIDLAPLYDGTEFEGLSDATLFIDDALSDKPEAANAALFTAVRETTWRGEKPKFIIHIADHGDRTPPSDALIAEMGEKNVFYIPVAVRGEGVISASERFVDDADYINSRHRTAGGLGLALPPAVTYDGRIAGAGEDEYEFVFRALATAAELGEEMKRVVIDAIFANLEANQVEEPAEDTARYLPGHAELTKAAIELFVGDIEALKAKDASQRTVAARGFVPTQPLGVDDTDWDYFAAIEPGKSGDLRFAFENACTKFADGDVLEPVEEALRKTLEVFTGDEVTSNELSTYFSDRDSIPLSTQTLLGDGILRLLGELNDPNAKERVENYQREFCRTAKLLSLVEGNKRISNPYEFRDGNDGDLIWREDSKTYVHRNATSHNWIYTDVFETRTVFLPLAYMPGIPSQIAEQ